MSWLIIANVVAIVCLAAACPHSQQISHTQTVVGTNCSVFYNNNNKSCCLPDAKCELQLQASNCSCSPHCHSDNEVECCEDIRCPPSKKIIIECTICIIICLYCFGIHMICHYMKLSANSAKTCQDFGCCFKGLTSSQCQGATLNINGTIQMNMDCSNKSAVCRK